MARDRESLTASVSRTWVAGEYIFLRFSLDGEVFTPPSAAYSAPSGTGAGPIPITFPLAWLGFGDFYIMAEIRENSSPVSNLESHFILLSSTGYRGY